MDPALPRTLRRLREALDRLPDGVAEAARDRARSRLDRDLLPRTAARDGALVAGIVGPNNAGKSALFNALVGAEVSPSLPTGGATRRLVGAAAPELAGALRALDGWERFELVDWSPGAGDPERPTTLSDRPAELLLTESGTLPADLLLIDTPDFDSVMRENRAASEALLAVADVALVVVTRHTYQNAALVDYLRGWLEHGRPWILVYNEAPSREIALEHAAKLGADLGHPALEVFQAPTDLEVMEGRAPLVPRRAAEEAGTTLAAYLGDLRATARLKAAALAASLAQLVDDTRALAEGLAERARAAARVHAHAADAARGLGARIASEAMPAGPFLAAFRAVLDRRSNRFSRRWRATMGSLRLRIESVPRLLGVGAREAPVADTGGGLEEVERPVLERAWPAFFEGLARDLGAERRAPVAAECPPPLARALEADLERPAGDGLERARAALAELPVDLAGFQATCEELVERAIEERGTDLDIQALADLATLLPVALGAVLIVKTGGFGADLGVAGGSVATSFLLDKYKHVLGSSVMREARRRWEEQRGGALSGLVYSAALPTAGEALADSATRDEARAGELAELAQALEGFDDVGASDEVGEGNPA